MSDCVLYGIKRISSVKSLFFESKICNPEQRIQLQIKYAVVDLSCVEVAVFDCLPDHLQAVHH